MQFAVLVVTPVDVIISREKEAGPRDNVLFELRLFMVCLDRERCLVVPRRGST
jgi:predicted nucleotide-binding protein